MMIRQWDSSPMSSTFSTAPAAGGLPWEARPRPPGVVSVEGITMACVQRTGPIFQNTFLLCPTDLRLYNYTQQRNTAQFGIYCIFIEVFHTNSFL